MRAAWARVTESIDSVKVLPEVFSGLPPALGIVHELRTGHGALRLIEIAPVAVDLADPLVQVFDIRWNSLDDGLDLEVLADSVAIPAIDDLVAERIDRKGRIVASSLDGVAQTVQRGAAKDREGLANRMERVLCHV